MRTPLNVTLLAVSSCIGLAGCGPSTAERLLDDPEVQRRIAEEEQREREWQAEFESTKRQVEEQLANRSDDPLNDPGPAVAVTEQGVAEAPDPVQGAAAAQRDAPGELPAENNAIGLPEPPPQAPAADRAKWRQLRFGMTADQVRQLLGEPTQQFADYYLVYWTYGVGRDAGRLQFVGGSGKLVAWDAP